MNDSQPAPDPVDVERLQRELQDADRDREAIRIARLARLAEAQHLVKYLEVGEEKP